MVLRIALVTGRRAEQYLRRVARSISEATGLHVDVIVAPYDVAALIPRPLLEKILSSLQGYDYVVVPGTLDYDVTGIGQRLGIRVVKGPQDPGLMALVASMDKGLFIEMLERGFFDYKLFASRLVERLAEVHSSARTIDVCGVSTPVRPPPFTVIGEVYVRKPEEPDTVIERVREFLARGADIVVLGFGTGADREQALALLRRVSDEVGPVGVDTSDVKLHVEAADRGYACLFFSATPYNQLVDLLPPSSGAVAVIPLLEDGVPRDPRRRVELVERLVARAIDRGLQPIADAVLEPPLTGLVDSIAAFKLLAAELADVPLMAGVANVYELMDVDSHGVIGLLVALLGEAGVSILLASEESRKAHMAVTETAIAATMISLALVEKRLPKDLGLDLLVVKEKHEHPEPSPPRPGVQRLRAEHIGSWYGLRLDPLGDHIIHADWRRGVIVDYHRSGRRPLVLEASSAKPLYKAITYLGLASEPSHYAYLGYELCRAELALRFHRSYVQDRDVLIPLWESRVFYSTRLRKVVEPLPRKSLRIDSATAASIQHGGRSVKEAKDDTKTRETPT